MLEYVMQHPSVYNITDQGACDSIVMFLKQIYRSGVLICDEKEDGIKAITAKLERWPIEYSTQVKKILVLLSKHQRIIFISCDKISLSKKSSCYDDTCKSFYEITESDSSIDAVIVPNACYEVLNKTWGNNAELVSSKKISLSEIDNKLKNTTRVILPGEMSKIEFNRVYLEPLFRSAGSIKIIDKMIGSSIKGNCFKDLSINYRLGLNYLIQSIAQSPNKDNVYVELVTALEVITPISRVADSLFADVCEMAQNIQGYVAELSDQYGIAIENVIKYKNATSGQMLHDRFIITDQFAFQIGRGIDLVTENDMMRDTTIALLGTGEASKLENYIRTLQDLKTDIPVRIF